ncbi:MAG TPA: PfkB family carbohydrate kinase [Kofleriaceae bacterium]|nr:PfkB family carbohydrate kinase [Kofleriaceae bacterium]
MSPPTVVGLGQATVAMVGIVPRLPEGDAAFELSEVSVQAGGSTAIACATAAALGCRARLATKIADDFLGPFILGALREAGLQVHAVRDGGARLSPFSFTTVASESHRRTTLWTAGDAGALTPTEIDLVQLCAGAGAVLVDGYYPAAQVALAEVARRHDIPVVLGGAEMREGLGELVGVADVLVCSERLAADLAPRGETRDSLAELQRMGPRAVIITLGDQGAIGLYEDEIVEQRGFPVDVADETGAGDVFVGAFAAALLHSLPFPRCLELATAASALSCRRVGAWAGIPDQDEVLAAVRAVQPA